MKGKKMLKTKIVSQNDPDVDDGKGICRVCLIDNSPTSVGIKISIDGRKWQELGFITYLGLCDYGERPNEKH